MKARLVYIYGVRECSDIEALELCFLLILLFPGRPEPVPLRDRFRRSAHGKDRGLRQHQERIGTESGKDKVRTRAHIHYGVFGRFCASILKNKKKSDVFKRRLLENMNV